MSVSAPVLTLQHIAAVAFFWVLPRIEWLTSFVLQPVPSSMQAVKAVHDLVLAPILYMTVYECSMSCVIMYHRHAPSWVRCMQAAIEESLRGMGSMCSALLEQLKADAKLAVKQALNANGPFELSPQASFLLSCLGLGQHNEIS